MENKNVQIEKVKGIEEMIGLNLNPTQHNYNVLRQGLVQVGVVGAGNAGCQTAQKAHLEKGFDAITFNTSVKDLKNVTADIPKIIVGNERGAGKDREVAIEYIYENHKKITDRPEVKDFIERNEVIVFVSSTGGGSGSGMAYALMTIFRAFAKKLDVLAKKRFLLVHILPQNKEGYLSLTNTAAYFKDIPEDNKVPFMSYDNNKYASEFAPSEVLSKVNQDIVDDLCVLRGDYIRSTPFESIDEEDLFRVLENPGRILIMKAEDIKDKDLDDKTIYDILVNNHLKNSAATEIQYDGKVAPSAVIANLPDKMAKQFNVYAPVNDFLRCVDIKTFPHIYKPQHGEANSVYLILSGLSRPTDRVKKIMERISEIEMEQAALQQDDGFYDLLGGDNSGVSRAKVDEVEDDLDAMFSRLRKK